MRETMKLQHVIGLGVAGNFTEHLEQAGEAPLESIAGWLERAGHPEQALISIGATRYTDYGEHHFVEAGDSSIVVAYDARRYDEQAIRELALRDDAEEAPAVSLLRQRVE